MLLLKFNILILINIVSAKLTRLNNDTLEPILYEHYSMFCYSYEKIIDELNYRISIDWLNNVINDPKSGNMIKNWNYTLFTGINQAHVIIIKRSYYSKNEVVVEF